MSLIGADELVALGVVDDGEPFLVVQSDNVLDLIRGVALESCQAKNFLDWNKSLRVRAQSLTLHVMTEKPAQGLGQRHIVSLGTMG